MAQAKKKSFRAVQPFVYKGKRVLQGHVLWLTQNDVKALNDHQRESLGMSKGKAAAPPPPPKEEGKGKDKE